MIRTFAFAFVLLLSCHAVGQDPIQTDPDHYKVVFENDQVRVLDYQDVPGTKTREHHHPAFVLYALTAFDRTLHLPNGSTIERVFNPGDVIFSEAQTHTGENTGTTPSHALLVELKQAMPRAGAAE